MKVLVLGATGFIGRELVEKLLEYQHEVIVFTRDHARASKTFNDRVEIVQWRTDEYIVLQEYVHKVDTVINLAGENLAAAKWTDLQKRKIISSRVNIGKALSFAIQQSEDKPYLLIQASAIGYYGFSQEKEFTEDTPAGKGFLPMVTKHWEDSVRNIRREKTRKVFIRTGLVLGRKGGLLPRMMMPFKFFAGAYLGDGKQWLSWIHIKDEVNAILFLLEKENSSGVYNLTAPNPVRMKDFAGKLGKKLGKPAWLAVPGFVLKAIYGNMARETMLQGQKVAPKRLQDEGFDFQYETLEKALEDLVKKK